MTVCYLDISASFSHSSLALPMLHMACVERVDVQWHVVRGTIKDDVHALSVRVAETRPDVVLATVYLFNHVQVMRIVRRIHALLPQAQLFLGGPEFLGHNEVFLRREPHIAAVCRGEGELALPELLQHPADPTAWGHLPGLCWLDADGTYRDNGTGALDETAWNALPPPSDSPFFDWTKPFIQIETNRGCAQFCTFCTSYRTGPTRWSPLERLRRILQQTRDHGVREVRVLDRTFNATPRSAIERLHLFAEEFADLRFHLEIHPAFLPKTFREALQRMPPGLLHLEVGLQTTHPQALIAAGRAGKPEVNWEGLSFLCGLDNVDVHADLIGALPGLTLDHQVRDLHALTQLRPAEIQLEILKVLPGTPVAHQAAGYGVKHAPDPPYEVLETPQMSRTEVQTTALLSQIIDRFFNQPVLRPAVVAAAEQNAQFYLDFLAFLKTRTDPAQPMSLQRRAQLLYDFLKDRDPASADLLAHQWLLAGMPPDNGVGRVSRWKNGVPEDATPIHGNGNSDGQVWRLDTELGATYFVFDRARDNRPVGVFEKNLLRNDF